MGKTLNEYRFVVMGAGINGRCLARALASASGGGRVALIDQFEPDHRRGSSHGEERITRSSYSDAKWVAAMQRAHAQDWPELERDLGQKIIVRGGDAVFFGPESGELPKYAAAVASIGADVDELDAVTARRRFPAFRFGDCERVLHDRTAGVIAAGAAMRGLWGWLAEQGVALCTGVTVSAIEEGSTGVLVHTDRGVFRADRAAVCAGAWASRLLPDLHQVVVPARQDVGFWDMGPTVSPGRFPAWVRLDDEGTHYGLPCFEGAMMKAAFHRTAAAGLQEQSDDPMVDRPASVRAVDRVESRLREWFTLSVPPASRMETCFYANVADDDFLVRWANPGRSVLVVSACSGHAFKLAPHTAREAAAILLS